MGFDPRRWRPSSGSRPLTTNVEALLAENEALRREVRSLRLQLEAVLQGERTASRSWEPGGARSPSEGSTSEAGRDVWSSSSRARASRPSWSSAEPPRSRVTVGSSHGLSADLVERWSRSLARHPRWQELRLGPPGGLRALEEELRRHWWNPSLSLEQELDRRCPGLGSELFEALRGPHSRGRWAVRVAFALYGPRAPEWLGEDPLRVAEELLRRVQQLERKQASQDPRRGTRTASNRRDGEDPQGHRGPRSASGAEAGSGRGSQRQRQRRGGTDGHEGQQRSGGRSAGSRPGAVPDPRAEALALLGLEPDASLAAIKRAYRRLAKAHHPDLGGDADAFRRLDAAYRSLL